MHRPRFFVVAWAIAILVSAAPAGAASKPALTRYSLAGGCFTIASGGAELQPGAGPFRLKAMALGRYLVYGKDRRFLASRGTTLADAPSPATEWRVDGDARRGFTMANAQTGVKLPVRLVKAPGCAEYPEAEVNAKGTSFKGTSPIGTVAGVIDTHAHLMGFELFGGEWHCGRPWHPYGAPYALPDCTSMRRGVNGVFADFLETGSPVATTDRRGWPTFKDWPKPSAVASEGDYYTAIQRAWLGGLRIMVSLSVENESLCAVMSQRRRPCNDMATARAQIADLFEMQNYVDAQSGGPGKGFFRVVTDPIQARRVINAGKLAVVIGIEVSRVLGCGQHFGVPECDRAAVDKGLAELRRLGVTSFFPIHKFDNAFGGTKMDAAEGGVIVDAGNVLATGRFWDVETCKTAEQDADQLTTPVTEPVAELLAGPLHALLPGGAIAPVYPPPPHCNTQDLTDLGRYLIEQMIQKRFIVELDHMDARTANSVLDLLERHAYPGVVSGHSVPVQLSPQAMPRIYRLGGFVSPTSAYTPKDYLDSWRTSVAARDPRFYNGGRSGSSRRRCSCSNTRARSYCPRPAAWASDWHTASAPANATEVAAFRVRARHEKAHVCRRALRNRVAADRQNRNRRCRQRFLIHS